MRITKLTKLYVLVLALLGNFRIEPNQTYTQQLILNEWYDFPDPGVYEVTASLAKARQQVEQACLNSTFKIEIVPFDATQVQQTCSGLVDRLVRMYTMLETPQMPSRHCWW